MVEDITLSSAELELVLVFSVLTTGLSAVFSLSAHPATEAEIIKIDIASKIGFIDFFIPILLIVSYLYHYIIKNGFCKVFSQKTHFMCFSILL